MNITIGRYEVPTDAERAALPSGVRWPSDAYECWVQDEARTWIIFVSRDGEPTVWLHRDPESGAVIGEPVTR